jgi:hypothetical protein
MVSTVGYVKLLLPPRQSRGNSHWGLETLEGYDSCPEANDERPCLHCLIGDLIDEFYAEYGS